MSTLYGIGVGVGDKSGLTLKAIKILEKVDVVILPEARSGEGSVAYEICKEYIPRDAEKLFLEFSMSKDIKVREESRRLNRLKIKSYLDAGKNLAFLTIGDPMVYSTFTYLIEDMENYKVETISGIPSFVDIAGRNNFPLVIGDESLKIISLNEKIDFDFEFSASDNIVFMKVGRNFNNLRNAIKRLNLMKNVIMVSNSGKDSEIVYYDLDLVEESDLSYFTTLIYKKGGF